MHSIIHYLDEEIKNSPSVSSFEYQLKNWQTHSKFPSFNLMGNRNLSVLHARLITDSILTVPRRWFLCGLCFGVRFSVMFHFMFVHYTFSSVWVAEWPPFGRKLPARLAICSHCILSICNIYLFPVLVLIAGFAFWLRQFLFIAFLFLLEISAATYLQIYFEISCLLVPCAVVLQRTKMQSITWLDAPSKTTRAFHPLGECGGLVVNASDSGSRGQGFEPHSGQTVLCPWARHIYSPKMLVIPRKRWLRPNMTEKLFIGT